MAAHAMDHASCRPWMSGSYSRSSATTSWRGSNFVSQAAAAKPILHAACHGRRPLILISSLPTTPPPQARRSSIMRVPTATDLLSLKIPSLRCAFPALLHSDYEAVKEACDPWIEAVAAPPSATASRFLHSCLLPLLVSRFIPKATSRQRLLHATKMISWLIIADDDDDHPDVLGSDSATASHRADLVLAVLRVNESSFDCSSFADAQPGFVSKSSRMLKALAELWDEIREEMSPSLQARFISAMADYLESLKVQASFREKVCIPDVEPYMEIRRQASFLLPSFTLMEYALGIELDEATFHNPLIHELRNVALDYICLCNDVVSCPTEIAMGDYFNLPSVLYDGDVPSSRFSSFQNAMDHVSQIAKDLNNRATSLVSAIHEGTKNIEADEVTSIHAYVDGLSLCMSGALAWHLESPRYHQTCTHSELHQLGNMNEMAT